MVDDWSEHYRFLDDFVRACPLNIDDRWLGVAGTPFAAKGIETMAAILFADMGKFSDQTRDLKPVETLWLANHYASHVTGKALARGRGIIDKYIGDELMIVFSEDFGSEDPFTDAITCARDMAAEDVLNFAPHFGIGYGEVVIGQVGTPIKFECTAYGLPVTAAKRCATAPREGPGSSSIVFPANLWEDRSVDELFPERKPDGTPKWRLLDTRPDGRLADLGVDDILEVAMDPAYRPWTSLVERAKQSIADAKARGTYRPRGFEA